MKLFIAISVLLVSLLSPGCKKEDDKSPQSPKPINLPVKAGLMISQSNSFGIDLFRETALVEEGNLMLSPLSASTALSMLLNGCGAETFTQIRDMLGYESLSLDEINENYNSLVSQLLAIDPKIQLALANAVWYRQDFEVKTPFLDRMQTTYKASTGSLDFLSPEALTTINNWAKDNTNGKIEKVLDEISPDAVMFLMNALYFKGDWTYKFDKSATAPLPFYPANGNAADVDMMNAEFPFKSFYGNNYKAIELPYGQQNFAMVLVMPSGPLGSFINGFNGPVWQEITSGLDASTAQTAELMMPKFRFDFEKVLNDQLKAMGMTDAFSPGMADLSGISDADIYVSFVKQNTFIDVNEEGTEAAAVTTIGIEYTSIPEPVVIDKPFIFAIRERLTNTLLFIGKVELPAY
ncbi:serpin family protein [Lentimicrobium sp.]|jgi:serpin B|uniref:serpin family protein n=1 Tax=Lentimicrobium sp. TaxID=2034841 RepID=UPI002BF7FDD7|nr:serpin family protein [Lentimicrobium sp.]HPF66024.1 serpin family protein [Lentimicrobium sp.]HPJ63603.1 serpin family protein [Lentimicrobium sp.]HRW70747.1 serpin family protein [Lentimicrobium sp.]